MKYFGKKYISGDNSQTESLVTGEWFPLAGNKWESPVETIIVSEPYKHAYSLFGKDYTDTFINVMYNHEVYRVLFLDWCVDRKMPDSTFDYFDWL